MSCGCCRGQYEDPNDLAVFGVLTDCNGRRWDLCGPCQQLLWAERAPRADPFQPLMA